VKIYKLLNKSEKYYPDFIVVHKGQQYELRHARGGQWNINPTMTFWLLRYKEDFQSLPPLSFLVITGLSFEEVQKSIEEYLDPAEGTGE